jgi:hypothetical protein
MLSENNIFKGSCAWLPPNKNADHGKHENIAASFRSMKYGVK